MSNKLFFTVFLGIVLTICGDQPPPEARLPTDDIKPLVRLSLLRPDNIEPREGDDVTLQCSAKPKNGSRATKPENVHWIKGNVGVPEPGQRAASERFVRKTSENERGVVLFTLTIKDAEPSDEDKYMCIVQVGQTGYFPSNELQLELKPGDPSAKKESGTSAEEQDLDEILKWKNRIDELSQDELKILADALAEDKKRKEEKERIRNDNQKRETKSEENLESLTKEEEDILKRTDAIGDMSETELLLLSKAMKKDKAIKKREQEEKEKREKEEKEKREKEEREKERERKERKEQEERIKRELEKKKEEEKLVLTPEEKAILQRKDELADFNEDEIKLLHSAMTKERNIEAREKAKQETKDKPDVAKDSDDELTEEEEEILKRKGDIRDMSQDELKIMARAVTKQKKLQEKRKKKHNLEDEKTEKKSKETPDTEERLTDRTKNTNSEDEMTEEEMREILKWKEGDISKLTKEQINLLGKALLKEKKMEEEKKPNDPLEDEELHDEL